MVHAELIAEQCRFTKRRSECKVREAGRLGARDRPSSRCTPGLEDLVMKALFRAHGQHEKAGFLSS